MHHGNDRETLDMLNEQMKDVFKQTTLEEKMEAEAEKLKLGATGRMPEEKLTPDDEGEIAIGITNAQGKVVMNFGKPVRWIGFTPQQARQIAASLVRSAEDACLAKRSE